MTLASQFQQAIAATPTFSSGDQTLRVDEGSRRLECHLTALEPLACAVLRLTLAADKLASMNSTELEQVAQNLSGRLTYLLEPISPIETDAEGCVVQMRSNPPQKNEDRTSYYELLVARAGQLTLCRYTRTPGQPRQVVPAELTREVLVRLAGDFVAAVA